MAFKKILCTVVISAATLFISHSSQAATITVDTTFQCASGGSVPNNQSECLNNIIPASLVGTPTSDGQAGCSIGEAIGAIIYGSDTADCVADVSTDAYGTNDTIVLGTNETYNFTFRDTNNSEFGRSVLPPIRGFNGRTSITVQCNGSTLTQDPFIEDSSSGRYFSLMPLDFPATNGTLTFDDSSDLNLVGPCHIRNGDAGSEDSAIGGAVAAFDGGSFSGSFFICREDVTFTNNFGGGGGAVGIEGGFAFIDNCHFNQNISFRGGAISASSSVLSVNRSSFNGNLAVLNPTTPANGFGGAIYSDTFLFDLSNSSFANNQAFLSGGAITTLHSILRSCNNTFAFNTAAQSGGALYNISTLTGMTHTTIANNVAGDSGGGIHNSSTALPDFLNEDNIGAINLTALTSCGDFGIIEDLDPGRTGGGPGQDVGGGVRGGTTGVISNTDDNFRVSDNLGLTVDNSTINGIGSLNTINSAIALNTAGASGHDCFGPITSHGNNFAGTTNNCQWDEGTDDQLGTADAPIDPLFSEFTITGKLSHYNLAACSPLIDRANDTVCIDNPDTPDPQADMLLGGALLLVDLDLEVDQITNPRADIPNIGADGSAAQCDIGAIEFQDTSAVCDMSSTDDGSGSDDSGSTDDADGDNTNNAGGIGRELQGGACTLGQTKNSNTAPWAWFALASSLLLLWKRSSQRKIKI